MRLKSRLHLFTDLLAADGASPIGSRNYGRVPTVIGRVT